MNYLETLQTNEIPVIDLSQEWEIFLDLKFIALLSQEVKDSIFCIIENTNQKIWENFEEKILNSENRGILEVQQFRVEVSFGKKQKPVIIFTGSWDEKSIKEQVKKVLSSLFYGEIKRVSFSRKKRD
jgi:hypothetical protein